MEAERLSIYPSTKVYTRADGTTVRHVSNRKYVRKIPKISENDIRVIAGRAAAGEKLSAIGADYGITYARTWGMLRRWREQQPSPEQPLGQAQEQSNGQEPNISSAISQVLAIPQEDGDDAENAENAEAPVSEQNQSGAAAN